MRKFVAEDLLIIGVIILLLMSGGSIPFVSPKPTAVTYVTDEKAVVPSGVSAALNELNAAGIVATMFMDDTTDGDNQVPDQYKITLPAAKAVGIPALVVQNGDTVIRTVKDPKTKDQVLEAVK